MVVLLCLCPCSNVCSGQMPFPFEWFVALTESTQSLYAGDKLWLWKEATAFSTLNYPRQRHIWIFKLPPIRVGGLTYPSNSAVNANHVSVVSLLRLDVLGTVWRTSKIHESRKIFGMQIKWKCSRIACFHIFCLHRLRIKGIFCPRHLPPSCAVETLFSG